MYKIKKLSAALLAGALSCSLCISGNAAGTFTDVPQSDTELLESVNDLIQMNIINGYQDGKVHPEEKVTRAEAAVMVYRILRGQGYPVPSDQRLSLDGVKTDYKDLDESHWAFFELVLQANPAKKYPVLEMYDTDKLGPDKGLTKLEAAKMLLTEMRYYELIKEDGYPDGVIYWADQTKIAEKEELENNGNDTITRGEFFVMLHKALDVKMAKLNVIKPEDSTLLQKTGEIEVWGSNTKSTNVWEPMANCTLREGREETKDMNLYWDYYV